jgi:hypothetical protein
MFRKKVPEIVGTPLSRPVEVLNVSPPPAGNVLDTRFQDKGATPFTVGVG